MDGISVTVVPERLRVFSVTEDNNELLIKIENRSDEAVEYLVALDIPSEVYFHYNQHTTEEFEVTGAIDYDRQARFDITPDHDQSEQLPRIETLDVLIQVADEEYNYEVELELRR